MATLPAAVSRVSLCTTPSASHWSDRPWSAHSIHDHGTGCHTYVSAVGILSPQTAHTAPQPARQMTAACPGCGNHTTSQPEKDDSPPWEPPNQPSNQNKQPKHTTITRLSPPYPLPQKKKETTQQAKTHQLSTLKTWIMCRLKELFFSHICSPPGWVPLRNVRSSLQLIWAVTFKWNRVTPCWH